jgi:hypothetical protein
MSTKSFTARIIDFNAANMKRLLLAEYLTFLQPEQRKLFDSIYPMGVPERSLDHALYQCEITIKHNSLGDRHKHEDCLS